MTLHEVPENDDSLNVSVMEGIVVGPVPVALDDLLAQVTAAPQMAVEPMVSVHVGGVGLRVEVAVHVHEDLAEERIHYIVLGLLGRGDGAKSLDSTQTFLEENILSHFLMWNILRW